MKVISLITRLNIGGASPPVIFQAAGLRARGHDSCLVCGVPGPREGSMEEDAVRAGAKLCHLASLRRDPHPINDASAMLELYRMFRRVRPDVVSTHMSKAGAIGRVAARAAGVPVIVHTYHGKGFHVFAGWKEQMTLAAERTLARLATGNIVVSDRQRAEFESLRIAPDTLQVIRYGLDLESFHRAAPADLRSELGLPAGTSLVGVVARVVAIKGQDVLLGAAARLRQRLPDVHFVIAGDGDARPAFERLAVELGVADRVHFLGWRRDIPAVLGALSLVVLPTVMDFEGTPLAVIEALAAGRPVVASDVGGVAEVVRHGETGLLVPPRAPEALADAIATQLGNPQRAQQMADAGRALVLDRYGREAMVDATERYFLRLLAGRGAGSGR